MHADFLQRFRFNFHVCVVQLWRLSLCLDCGRKRRVIDHNTGHWLYTIDPNVRGPLWLCSVWDRGNFFDHELSRHRARTRHPSDRSPIRQLGRSGNRPSRTSYSACTNLSFGNDTRDCSTACCARILLYNCHNFAQPESEIAKYIIQPVRVVPFPYHVEALAREVLCS